MVFWVKLAFCKIVVMFSKAFFLFALPRQVFFCESVCVCSCVQVYVVCTYLWETEDNVEDCSLDLH